MMLSLESRAMGRYFSLPGAIVPECPPEPGTWPSARVAERARMLLETSIPKEHNYLHRMGLGKEIGLVLPDGDLFVPMRNIKTGDLVGGQVVVWHAESLQWQERFVGRLLPSGAMFRAGPSRPAETIFAVGYADGLSVAMAVRQMRLNAAVVVTFTDGNLMPCEAMTAGRAYATAGANDLHATHGLMAVCALVMRARAAEPVEVAVT